MPKTIHNGNRAISFENRGRIADFKILRKYSRKEGKITKCDLNAALFHKATSSLLQLGCLLRLVYVVFLGISQTFLANLFSLSISSPPFVIITPSSVLKDS